MSAPSYDYWQNALQGAEYWSLPAKPCRKPLPCLCYFEDGREWRTIPLLELGNRYEVSSDGVVRSARTRRVRSQVTTDRGYKKVRLDGRFYFVHRLLGYAFLGWPRPDQTHTNHLDNDHSANRVGNIQWATPRENSRHAQDIGAVPPLRGEANGASKLTEAQVAEIRSSYTPGIVRQIDLAARYGVSQRAISLIVRLEKWTHV